MRKRKVVVQALIQAKVYLPTDQSQTMRGLKALVFGRFQEKYVIRKKVEDLPDIDEVADTVRKFYPQSRFLLNPKNHYKYYKSLFISSVREGKT